MTDFRRVMALGQDDLGKDLPADQARTLGYLQTVRGTLRGSFREHETIYIMDADQKRVGMVDEGGRIFRFDAGGVARHVTTDDLPRGLGKFFNLPPRNNVRIYAYGIAANRPDLINPYADIQTPRPPPAAVKPPTEEKKPEEAAPPP